MLSLEIGEELEHTRKRSFGDKLQNLSIIFYHIVLPGMRVIWDYVRLTAVKMTRKFRKEKHFAHTLATP